MSIAVKETLAMDKVRPNTASLDPDHLDRLISENEAAQFLGYTVRALQNWRLRGGGPKFVKVSSRSVRYRLLTMNSSDVSTARFGDGWQT